MCEENRRFLVAKAVHSRETDMWIARSALRGGGPLVRGAGQRARLGGPVVARALCAVADSRERILLAAHAQADRLITNGDVSRGCKVLDGVVDGLRELRGSRHPDTISAMGYLSQQLLRVRGREDDSERLAREASELADDLLGERHSDALLSAANLAGILSHRGAHEEAEQLCRRCYEAAKLRAGGAASEELQMAASDLAEASMALDGLDAALDYAREACELAGQVYGVEHTHTIDELSSLGALLEAMGDDDEAEVVWRRTLRVSRKALGRRHPHTLVAQSHLARLLAGSTPPPTDASAVGAADSAPSSAYASHASTSRAAISHASHAAHERRMDEAERLMRDGLVASAEEYGHTHAQTLVAASNLAQCLLKRGRFHEACQLATASAEGCDCLVGDGGKAVTLLRRVAFTAEAMEREAVEREVAGREAAHLSLLLLASWPPPGEAWGWAMST